MGVDFYPCDRCGETFCDAGDWAQCEDCGRKLCPVCMRKFRVRHGMAGPESTNLTEYPDEFDPCPFCSKDVVTHDELLRYALHRLSMNKDQLIAAYKNATK